MSFVEIFIGANVAKKNSTKKKIERGFYIICAEWDWKCSFGQNATFFVWNMIPVSAFRKYFVGAAKKKKIFFLHLIIIKAISQIYFRLLKNRSVRILSFDILELDLCKKDGLHILLDYLRFSLLL